MEGTPKKIFTAITIAGAVVGVVIAIIMHTNIPVFDRNCDPNYSPCVPDVSYDLNCSDIKKEVTVKGYDKYRLDRDGDGLGCETYAGESVIVPMIIYGAAGAFAAGWVGLFVAWGYESHEAKTKKSHEHHSSSD